MSDDLVYRLRNNVKQPFPLMEEAADEIERLRGLITEWADAEDAVLDTGIFDLRFFEALLALREAVGRG